LLPANDSPVAAEATPQIAMLTKTFAVEKMTCAGCPITVKRAMSKVGGVSTVEVDFATKTAKVTFDPKRTNADAIGAASANAGYPATPQQGGDAL
jgi:mercuric ion binding protein